MFRFVEKQEFLLGLATLLLQGLAALFEVATFFYLFGSLRILSQDKEQIFASFLLLLFLALFMQIAKSLFLLLSSITQMTFINRLRERICGCFRKQILTFSFSSISDYKIGGLGSIFKIPFEGLTTYLESLFYAMQHLLVVIALLGALLYLSPLFTAVVLLFISAALFGQYKISHRVKKKSQLYADCVTNLCQYFTQILSGIRVITTFHLFDSVEKKLQEQTKKTTSTIHKLVLGKSIQNQLAEIALMTLVIACALVGYFIFQSKQTQGIFLLITYLAILLRASRQISSLLLYVTEIKACGGEMDKLLEFLQSHDKEYAPNGTKLLLTFSKEIRFNHVCHNYSKSQKVLHDISFKVQKGESIAFVGKSGSGKSTLVDLLLRLYEPQSGEITIDGSCLKEIDIGSWRGQLGVVSQDTHIFNDTVYNNINIGNCKISHQKLQEIAEMAGCHEFIRRLPAGYDAILGERGYRLSGGERQRISLARALLRDPEILILDEATSSLDTLTERYILSALEKFYRKKTLLIIAHRLSTIHFCDRIYCLERGEIVEEGSHEQLVALEGFYSKMWQQQTARPQEVLQVITGY